MRSRTRTPGLVAVATLGLLGMSAGAVWAALPPPGGTAPAAAPTLGPTTTAPGSTTSSLLFGAPSTTTTAGGPTTAAGPTTTGPTSTTSPGGATTTTQAPSGGGDYNPLVGSVPPDAQAIINSAVTTPPGDNAALVAALRPLTSLGLTPTDALVAGSGRFPVAAPVGWSDGFYEARFDASGAFRFHHAIDIPAPCGTPLRAPDAGMLVEGSDPGGGNTVEITEPDGTYIYLAHLSAYAPGQASGQPVQVGQVVGAVGATGAATGCHLHLEIHPLGGAAVDPKPFVDAWYRSALAAAPLLVAAAEADRGLRQPAGAPVTTGPTARIRAASLVPAAPVPLRTPDRRSPAALAAAALGALLSLLTGSAVAASRRRAGRPPLRRPGPGTTRGRPTP